MLDVHLPDGNGLELLEPSKRHTQVPAIVMSGQGAIDIALEQFGKVPMTSSTAVHRPRTNHHIQRTSFQSTRRTRDAARKVSPRTPCSANPNRCKRCKRQFNLLNECGFNTGESGTGKELIARSIHERSKRSDVHSLNWCGDPVNSSSRNSSITRSVTGATASRRGKFELADKGTIPR